MTKISTQAHTKVSKSMMDFIEASPTPFHCVAQAAKRLKKEGYTEVQVSEDWRELKGEKFFFAYDGAFVAWHLGTQPFADAGARIIGAHTDSPNFRVKPVSTSHRHGMTRLNAEPYGGILAYTWFDRDLGVAGRVVGQKGKQSRECLVRMDDIAFRIPSLAIHLNRGVNKEGFKPNMQNHAQPIACMGGEFDLTKELKARTGLDHVDGYDLAFFDLQKPSFGGVNQDFIFAPRLDNQASCFQALEALARSAQTQHTNIIALYDHEEVGSRSASGAMGQLIKGLLQRIAEADHNDAFQGFERGLAKSIMISVDMAHALHPNYPELHDANHKPMFGEGPVIKTHTETRYATDGSTGAFFRRAAKEAGVPTQEFSIRSDLACGSTIGPITSANLGMATVDVGNPMLSMHSIREQCARIDVEMMVRALTQCLQIEFR